MTSAGTVPVSRLRLRRLRSWPARCCLLAGLIAVLVLVVNPARVQYHLQRGRKELLRNAPQQALDQFHAAERLAPERAETQFWLARASRKTGDVEGVRRRLDRALELQYADPERLRREWWLVLAETGRIREVEGYLPEMLLKPGADDIEICDAFARGYCLNLQFDQALALLNAWQADHPDDHRPHFRRAQIHAGNEQWAEAEAACREALRLAPADAASHRELGKTLLQLQRPDEAKTELQKAVELAPSDREALLLLARVFREDTDFAGATDCLWRVLEQDPRHEPARLLLADVLLAVGDAEGAIEQVQPIVDLWPEDLQSRYTLARALRAVGRMGEAESHLRTYAQLEPSRARLEAANRNVRRQPQDADARYELGLLLLKHESRGEGVAWLHSVLPYEPGHAGAHQALAEYYDKIGDAELARRHRQHANPDHISAPPDGLAGHEPTGAASP